MTGLLAKAARAARVLLASPYAFIMRMRHQLSPASTAKRMDVPTYAEWLDARIKGEDGDVPDTSSPRFSLITTVYQGTDAAYLRETADALRAQKLPFHEWLLLAHGPVSAAVDELLRELEQDIRIKIERIPVNLGIAGGMRSCLERATGEYVVPVDADDLLTENALSTVAAAIRRVSAAKFLYSDEDALIGGVPREPYWRPDWDPVLNWSSSYIWHLCVMHRTTALGLGVYADPGSEFCQDWDTVFRFSNAGHAPVHIPEILYHWRQHAASTTHRPQAKEASVGSIASTRHLLRQQISRLPQPQCYDIEAFPISRGPVEWHVMRRHVNPAGMDLVLLTRNAREAFLTLQSLSASTDYPLAKIILAGTAVVDEAYKDELSALAHSLPACGPGSSRPRIEYAEGDGLGALFAGLAKSTQPLIAVCTDAITFSDGSWAWEAVKWTELCGDTAVVCGRLFDEGGFIAHGAVVFDDIGRPRSLDHGELESYGGKYALLLKPHSVHLPPVDLFVAKADFLRCLPVDAQTTLDSFGMWMGAQALRQGRRVVFSPVIRAKARSGLLTVHGGAMASADCAAFWSRCAIPPPARNIVSARRFAEYKDAYR